MAATEHPVSTARVTPLEAKAPFYISTAINYANGAPHIGHAYEAIVADCVARYHRAYGRDVFFMTGSDEHGQKIKDAATAQGLRPIELTDRYAAEFQSLNAELGISNDRYIRTTEPSHYRIVQELWKTAASKGDIYLGSYTGWYNTREEAFVTDTEAKRTEFVDPVSQKPLVQMSEESYFFRLSKYVPQLIEHIKNNPTFVQPESAAKDLLSRLTTEEITDLSVSRCAFDWGVPVPSNDQHPDKPHVMYVWFDALPNYLSGLNYGTDSSTAGKYWPCNVHLIGKDINWFHSVIWPCMLMSVGEALPRQVFSHGFILGPDGKKMSKSVGNVVDPRAVLQKYGVDAFRYFLLRVSPLGSDLIFSERRLVELSNADLLKSFGNLLHRATNLCKQSCGGVICTDQRLPLDQIPLDLAAFVRENDAHYTNMDTFSALESLLAVIHRVNQWITELAPWSIKDDLTRKQIIIVTLLEMFFALSHFLAPVVPHSIAKVFERFNTAPKLIPELSTSFQNLPVGTAITVGTPLYTLLEFKVLPVQELDLKVGKIASVKKHPDADKLYLLQVDFAEAGTKQILAGLTAFYQIEELQDRHVVALVNLKPSSMRGQLSEGMLLCSEHQDDQGVTHVQLLQPSPSAPIGSAVHGENLPPICERQIRIQDFQKISITVQGGRVVADGFTLLSASAPITSSSPDGAKVK